MALPEIGKKAPAFTMAISEEEKRSLKDYAGKKLVLYFYPKDDTPGCTKQAIGFTEHLADFEAENCEILGVSKDTIAKHEKFKTKHDLAIDLAADPENKIIEKYGSWVEKNMYGRKYMGIERSTFLIDEKGVVRQIWRKVRVKDHIDQVLEAVRDL